jgi:hypothetical protein
LDELTTMDELGRSAMAPVSVNGMSELEVETASF